MAYSKFDARQVVPVILEHAFSKVSLYVTRATSMNDIAILNLRVSFDNLNYKSKMICTVHKEYDVHNVKYNEWPFTHDQGAVATPRPTCGKLISQA